jgi:hypothetical protein
MGKGDQHRMPIWKITARGHTKVSETELKREKLLEEKLEDRVVSEPELLGEPLLVIGRQVIIPDVKDRLDILALDSQGNAVIIELKRGEGPLPLYRRPLRLLTRARRLGTAKEEGPDLGALSLRVADGGARFRGRRASQHFSTQPGRGILEPFAKRLNLIASHQLASTSAFQLLFC